MASATPFRFRPSRIRFPAQHRFFEEGDVQRHLQLRALREQGASPREEERDRASATSCPACARPFLSLAALERHYQARHRLACAACARPAPSAHLLALHLLERHRDALFALQARRGPAYRCLLESCPEKFRSSRERKAHLEHVHRYPPDFRFLEPQEGPDSCPEPAGPLPRWAALTTEDAAPAEAMETGCTEDAAEDPNQPLTESTSSPAGHRWRYRARIPKASQRRSGVKCNGCLSPEAVGITGGNVLLLPRRRR